jgi:hypothetical protein
MVVFLNAFVLSDAQRQVIRRRCMCDNRLLVWLYAPGLINGDRLAVENVSSLLGMTCRMEAARPAGKVAFGLAGEKITYDGASVSPFLYVQEGADATPGCTPDERIVVAEKAGPNCRNVLVAMPPLPSRVLQHYAKRAGVHLYAEGGEVVLVNEHYLAVAAATAGLHTIRLPREAALQELLELGKGERFLRNRQFQIEIPAHTCRIFQLSY